MILFVLVTVLLPKKRALVRWGDVVNALEVCVHGVPLALNSLVEPFKVPAHPIDLEVQVVDGVGDGGKVGPGLGFGWASGSAALSDRFLKCRMHDCMEEFEVLAGHNHVPVLPWFEDAGHDVEKEAALGGPGVDGGATRGVADEGGDVEFVEDQPLVVDHPIFSVIVGDVITLVGEASDAPKRLDVELDQCALDKAVEHVVLTPEFCVKRIIAKHLQESHREDSRGSHNPLGEESEEAGAFFLRIEPKVRPVSVVKAFVGGRCRIPGFGLGFPGGFSPALVLAHFDEE
ncbi:unnamed protein product [Cuscuta campestris]|uniref:Uncharacterized protein n=1 Tax=Cuscuta campestris TaxID=132261 RepID=A0A484N4X5_9ASTE|nr:unnamed protein product [Cuscuta campestris]